MNDVKLVGQTWIFNKPPYVTSSGTVVGKNEGEGPLGKYFDIIHQDNWLGEDSFEKAEQKLLEESCNVAIRKANLKRDDINFHFSGDLLNQTVSSCFTGKSLSIPYLGIFGACSTSMEGLSLASYLVATGGAEYVMASTGSHTNTAEKQFRYPNEYGSQKCDTAQCTVIGAGSVIVGCRSRYDIRVTSATVGKVVDFGIADPFNMGAAMAPAAADTIARHLEDRKISADYYDMLITGDLGKVGLDILMELLKQRGIEFDKSKINDGGKMIYPDNGKFFAGGSGCGCMATVAYGYILKQLEIKKLKKVLCVATGALLSSSSVQQKLTIPSIAHAVSLELSEVIS